MKRLVTADHIENSTVQTGDHAVNTGGGAYVGGSVTAGGDFVGRDQIVGGRQASPDVSKAFSQLSAAVALKASSADVERAMQLVTDMQAALAHGDDNTVADCINELSALVPDVQDRLVLAFSQPPLREQVGPVAKYFPERLQ